MLNACFAAAVLLLTQPAPNPLTTTPSGLQFQDLKVGTGPVPAKGQRCVVHYTGWLWERGRKGLVFDTSREGGEPIEFKLGVGQVIKAWDEGLATLRVGGKRRLIVPAALGYGSQGTPDGAIPPHATLCFEVELLAVK